MVIKHVVAKDNVRMVVAVNLPVRVRMTLVLHTAGQNASIVLHTAILK